MYPFFVWKGIVLYNSASCIIFGKQMIFNNENIFEFISYVCTYLVNLTNIFFNKKIKSIKNESFNEICTT